jgi:hypothetical protein
MNEDPPAGYVPPPVHDGNEDEKKAAEGSVITTDY